MPELQVVISLSMLVLTSICTIMLWIIFSTTRTELQALRLRISTLEFYENERVNPMVTVAEMHAVLGENAEEVADESEEAFPDANLSVNERILLREEELDRRFNKMRAGEIYPYNPAVSLHESVHNIPHRVIDLKDAHLPDVEVTE